MSGCSPISLRMSGPSTPTTIVVSIASHGGRAALVLEHRELAEDVAGAERRERDRAPVAVRADRARVALADDVAGVAGVALAEHDLLRRELARHRHLGDPLEVAALERRERRDPSEQLDNVR